MSKIEWTQRTWNPIVGCSIVSPGCTNCYAMNMAARLEAISNATRAERGGWSNCDHYLGTTMKSKAGPVWSGKLAIAPDRILMEPLRRKKATTYFVNSMGDLFHDDVPDEWIDRVFAVSSVTVFTAGSGHASLLIPGLLVEEAERLRDALLGRERDVQPDAS